MIAAPEEKIPLPTDAEQKDRDLAAGINPHLKEAVGEQLPPSHVEQTRELAKKIGGEVTSDMRSPNLSAPTNEQQDATAIIVQEAQQNKVKSSMIVDGVLNVFREARETIRGWTQGKGATNHKAPKDFGDDSAATVIARAADKAEERGEDISIK